MQAGVEVYWRAASDHEVLIVENDGLDEMTVELPAAMTDLLTGETVRAVKLPLYGVVVLKETESGKE